MGDSEKTIGELATGTRLLYRSNVDWRFAVVSRVGEEKVVLTVCSPSGRTYRLSRLLAESIEYEGLIPILSRDYGDDWRDNFSEFDSRW